jgi:hypothetical protein
MILVFLLGVFVGTFVGFAIMGVLTMQKGIDDVTD